MIVPVLLVLPLAAHADPFRPSREQQIQLGERAAKDLKAKEKVLPESDERVKLLRSIGNRIIAKLSDKDKNWPYTFDVIDKNEVNAFALPGGKTFFYTGLLSKMKTEDELAAVVGHELTHVYREHFASSYADAQKRELGLAVLLTILRADRNMVTVAAISNQLLFDLPFSRRHETEADDRGTDAMVLAGFNPTGAANVFRMFQELKKGGASPEFLSTHPDDKNRVKRIEDRIKKMKVTWGPLKPLPWAKP